MKTSRDTLKSVRARFPFPLLFLILSFFICAPARAQIDDAQFRRDLQALTRSPSRVVGSTGYAQALDYLEAQIQSLPNVELKRHDFPVLVPVTTRASLHLSLNDLVSDVPIHPFWPASVRVCSTPPNGITGRAIYCGTLKPSEIPPQSLHGNIAVIEASSAEDWPRAFEYGASAAIVLGSPDTSNVDLRWHELQLPVNFPRFYIPPGALADALRSGSIKDPITLTATVTWQRKMASNLYALIKPSHKIANWTQTLPPAALMISVPFDSSSLVPDLAPGASQAVQTAAGLALVRDLSAHPWDRPVVVYFSGADSIQMLATRNMCLAFAEAPARWRKEIATIDKESTDLTNQLQRARAVADAPQSLRATEDRDLIARVIQTIETDAAIDQDELFRLRTAPPDQRTPQLTAQEHDLDQRQLLLNRLRFTLQRDPGTLDAQLVWEAKKYIDRTIAQIAGADNAAPSSPEKRLPTPFFPRKKTPDPFL